MVGRGWVVSLGRRKHQYKIGFILCVLEVTAGGQGAPFPQGPLGCVLHCLPGVSQSAGIYGQVPFLHWSKAAMEGIASGWRTPGVRKWKVTPHTHFLEEECCQLKSELSGRQAEGN